MPLSSHTGVQNFNERKSQNSILSLLFCSITIFTRMPLKDDILTARCWLFRSFISGLQNVSFYIWKLNRMKRKTKIVFKDSRDADTLSPSVQNIFALDHSWRKSAFSNISSHRPVHSTNNFSLLHLEVGAKAGV